MELRIAGIGKEYAGSDKRSLLCFGKVKDELGFSTLCQFQWEIDKESFTKEVEANIKKIVDEKKFINRPFRLSSVNRTNPETKEVINKLIAIPM